MDLTWFRLADARKRKLDSSVWIPLKAVDQLKRDGEYATLGFEEEFFGAGSIAVPLTNRKDAEKLGWDSVGIGHPDEPHIEDGIYIPSEVFSASWAKVAGIRLVLDQRGNRDEHAEWHLHQDLVIALGLRREGDRWIAIHEGYVEVARLARTKSGGPRRLEIKAEFLKDYLCARSMALYVSWYRNRVRVVESTSDIPWLVEREVEETDLERWSGRAAEIHEGGMLFGAETAVFHVAHADIAVDEDVPRIPKPGSGSVKSQSWTIQHKGRRLVRVEGEVWKREWVEQAATSPRIRRDKIAPTVHFIIDASGRTETSDTLREGGRWLWFRPEVIAALIERRGGRLAWYTRDTGGVAASPDDEVHFGVNALGLVTVYAKDIAYLSGWQQRIWAGYNVSPEGGISAELHASQVLATPADTQAPEAFLKSALADLNVAGKRVFGETIFREHAGTVTLLAKTHRFRAVDEPGLFALAKDIARLTADSLDAGALQRIVAPPKGEKWGSLKSLERVLATASSAKEAHYIVGPLFAAYELRQGDAHLASDLRAALQLAGVESSSPFVEQGRQLLAATVTALVLARKVVVAHEPETNSTEP